MMRLYAFLFLLICSGAEAQWLRGAGWIAQPQPADFDRGHPVERHTRFHPLSMTTELPNWPFPNVDVTNSPDSDQTEPSVQINPNAPGTVVIGANDDRSFNALWAYASNDSGRTWRNQALPPVTIALPNVNATDPSIACASDGTVYFGNGQYVGTPFNYTNDVACFRSTDLGTNWSVAGYPFLNTNSNLDTTTDKYFITVDADPKSPFHGRIYATWVEVSNGQQPQICFSFSNDQGATWSQRLHLTGHGYYTAPVPAAGSDSSLIIVFDNYTLGSHAIMEVHSKDGGETFTSPQVLSPYNDVGPWRGDTATNDGYPVVKDTVRANSFPAIAIDHSSQFPNRAYVTWCGKDSNAASHVFYAKSSDDGTTWSTPGTVDGDFSTNPKDKFFSTVAVDPVSGDVGIIYYDSRLDTNNILCDIFMTFSSDGMISAETHRISSASTDPRIGRDYWSVETPHGTDSFQFFGDYVGISGKDSTWCAAWTDGRAGNDLDIYSAKIQPYAPMPVTNLAVKDTIANGKHSAVLSWEYSPAETTMGFPLPNGFQFVVAKNGSMISTQKGNLFRYLDTNASTPAEYEVWVVSGSFRSIVDSVHNTPSGVAGEAESISSIRFVCEPALVGAEDKLILDCAEACSISLMLYDELGRTIGEVLSDGIVSSHHAIPFISASAGIRWYVVKESTASETRELFGKLVVEP